jgi:hypothetical protein
LPQCGRRSLWAVGWPDRPANCWTRRVVAECRSGEPRIGRGDRLVARDDRPGAMRVRLLIVLTAAIVLETLAAACSLYSAAIPTAEVLGSWRGGAARLSLSKDGGFTASDLPSQRADPDAVPYTGIGTWTMVPAGNSQPQHLDLTAGHDGLGWLFVERSHGKVILYYWIGDPDEDNKFVFTRPRSG